MCKLVTFQTRYKKHLTRRHFWK